jgi:riboflavin synthase
MRESNRVDMFTGIVEETGRVEKIEPIKTGIRLLVSSRVCARDLKQGDSLAVNGCCLTVEKMTGRAGKKIIQFSLLAETWIRTNLQFVKPGNVVNLERPLRADGRFGGHFVTGHIDGTGKIMHWEPSGKDYVLDVSAPPEILRYIVQKGSIAIDGISLTVAEVNKKMFRVWIIPHTYKVTALHERKVGEAVNLETDLLGKYAERFATFRKT